MDIPANAPAGWAALAARPTLPWGKCATCGKPAIVGTFDVYRCVQHPPTGREWGAGLNWTPTRITDRCPGLMCYCGRCSQWRPAPKQTVPREVQEAADRARRFPGGYEGT